MDFNVLSTAMGHIRTNWVRRYATTSIITHIYKIRFTHKGEKKGGKQKSMSGD